MASLKGLTIIDFSQMMTGPFSTQMLRDFGAQVIKIEPPEGDPFLRSGESTVDGLGVFYVSLNRGKSIERIDLKDETQRSKLLDLLKTADVIVENFRSGVTRKLGIDYETLCRENPRLVYCSIVGFEDPVNMMRPALDQIVQAESGLMQLTGTPETGPLKTGFPLTDLLGGLYATIGIMNALYHRQNSGEGQYVRVSMMGCAVHSLVPRDVYYSVTGMTPPLSGNEHWDIVPNNVYAAADGKTIMVIAINDKYWKILVNALGIPEAAEDPEYATKAARLINRKKADSLLAAAFEKKAASEWDSILRKAGAIYGLVRTWDEVIGPAGIMRNIVQTGQITSGEEFEFIQNPLHFSRTPVDIPRTVEKHG